MHTAKISKRAVLAGLTAGLAGVDLAALARAGDWPQKPLNWIVPHAPEGSGDIYATPLAARVSRQLGEPVTIDNQAGGGGMQAASLFARTATDGYTWLVGYTGLVYASTLYPKSGAGFDFARVFTPVSAFAREPLALVANPANLGGIDSLPALVAAVKRRPQSIEMGSDERGSVSYLAVYLLEEQAGLDFLHAPYHATQDVVFELAYRRLGVAFLPLSALLAQGGESRSRVKVLAVAARRRDPQFPDAPTFAEAGIADFRASQWFGLFARTGTPAAILDRMHEATQAGLEDAEVKALWARHAARVDLESRADYARFVTQEIGRWGRLAKKANLRLE
jgi:tripartite-type tricarboxylate transporter receptor subunit TctC